MQEREAENVRVGKIKIILFMKKNFIFFALVATCVLFFASCMTIQKTEYAKAREVTGLGVLQIPTVATLDVSQTKVTELFTIRVKNKFLKSMATGRFNKKTLVDAPQFGALEAAQSFAVAKLLTKHNADVLVEPRYSFEVTSTLKRSTYNVIVSGYPATYKNFRPATPADTEILKINPPTTIPQRMQGTLETD